MKMHTAITILGALAMLSVAVDLIVGFVRHRKWVKTRRDPYLTGDKRI